MKKIILISTMSFIMSLAINAQITITQNNIPVIGYNIIEAQDTIYTGITVGNAGANQTWDFSNWVNHTQDTTNCVNSSTLSGANNFPGANLGFIESNGDLIFANSSSTSLNILGAYGPVLGTNDMAVIYNPYDEIISFPSTYNTTFSGSYSYSVVAPFTQVPPFDSIKVTASVQYSSLIDAYGTVSTPQFSNIPCIRQKIRAIATQEVYVHDTTWFSTGNITIDTTYNYSWWSNAYNYSLASIGTDSAGTITSTGWLLSYLPADAGIQENPVVKNGINVFPNPSSDHTTITYAQFNEEGEIDVYNLLGQVVYRESIAKESTQTELNIQNYKAGIYKVILKENGAVKGQESLIKQ